MPQRWAESSALSGSTEGGTPPILTLAYTMPVIMEPPSVPTPLPAHYTTTLPVDATAPLRWTGSGSKDTPAPDTGGILLLQDPQLMQTIDRTASLLINSLRYYLSGCAERCGPATRWWVAPAGLVTPDGRSSRGPISARPGARDH